MFCRQVQTTRRNCFLWFPHILEIFVIEGERCHISCGLVHPVAYAEISDGEAKFRHNRVTSQINFRGSAEGTAILGGPGACPRKNFAKLHLKIRIFVHSGSKFQTILFLPECFCLTILFLPKFQTILFLPDCSVPTYWWKGKTN